MSDRLFLGVVFGIVFLLFVLAGLAIWMLLEQLKKGFQQSNPEELEDADNEHSRRLLAKARRTCGAKACCKCTHWDLDSGQTAIAQNPNFLIAAQRLSPSRMGRSADDDSPRALPLALDKWELFGACAVENSVRHAIDKCPSFQKV